MKLQHFSIIIVFLFVSACAPKINMSYQRTGMVTCQKHDKMTITVLSEGQAENVGKAVGFAERNAIENILFKGIPKSNQEKPLIPNEYSAKDSHGDFLFDLVENGGYKSYIMSSLIDHDFNSGGVHLVNQEIQIDLTNLRKHLESNGVVRKFGF